MRCYVCFIIQNSVSEFQKNSVSNLRGVYKMKELNSSVKKKTQLELNCFLKDLESFGGTESLYGG